MDLLARRRLMMLGSEVDPADSSFSYVPQEGSGEELSWRFVSGMTWGEFCNSKYNNGLQGYTFWIDDGGIFGEGYVLCNIDEQADEVVSRGGDMICIADDLLVNGITYRFYEGGGDEPAPDMVQ